MILLGIAAVMSYFNLQQLFTLNSATMYEYSFVICNIVCSLSLLVAALYKLHIERALSKQISLEDEDATLNKYERKFYKVSFFCILAAVLSLVTLIVSFISIRDSNPDIVWNTCLLFMISLFSFFAGQKTSDLIFPNSNELLAKPAKSVEETLNYYDDGQKHVMLKTLYRLYFACVLGLVLLMFFLMLYSIFSGVSQIMSIIGIGIILFGMLLTFTMCLKPKKIVS